MSEPAVRLATDGHAEPPPSAPTTRQVEHTRLRVTLGVAGLILAMLIVVILFRRGRFATRVVRIASYLGRPPVPRVLPYVLVKRTNSRVGDTFGHWWVEIGGTESYGWWPEHCPLRVRDFLFGTRGTLNGVGSTCGGGTPTTDPHHLDAAEHAFHPTLFVRKSDRSITREIRRFARSYSGQWRWSTKPTQNCRSFQLELLDAVGLIEGAEHEHTRGSGCPFLAPFRSARLLLRPSVRKAPLGPVALRHLGARR